MSVRLVSNSSLFFPSFVFSSSFPFLVWPCNVIDEEVFYRNNTVSEILRSKKGVGKYTSCKLETAEASLLISAFRALFLSSRRHSPSPTFGLCLAMAQQPPTMSDPSLLIALPLMMTSIRFRLGL